MEFVAYSEKRQTMKSFKHLLAEARKMRQKYSLVYGLVQFYPTRWQVDLI